MNKNTRNTKKDLDKTHETRKHAQTINMIHVNLNLDNLEPSHLEALRMESVKQGKGIESISLDALTEKAKKLITPGSAPKKKEGEE